MLTIRLTRKGKKNQPFFRVVLVDKRRSSTGGRAVEDLGYVDPLKKRRSFNAERIKYWISKGAQVSTTIHNLLVTEKIIDKPKIKVSNISKKKQAEIATAKKAKAEQEVVQKVAAEKVEPAGETPSNDGATPAETPATEAKEEPAAPVETPETTESPEVAKPSAAAESSGETKEEKPVEGAKPAEEAKPEEKSV